MILQLWPKTMWTVRMWPVCMWGGVANPPVVRVGWQVTTKRVGPDPAMSRGERVSSERTGN